MTKASSRLPAPLRPGLEAYALQVKELTGSSLESLVVFGAVLTPDWQKGRHIHHALVLSSDDLDLISRLHVLSSGAVKLGLAAPLVLTPALLTSTLDTFPLEWLEIATCHEVLSGVDLFQGLTFAHEHVRLQCERESAVLAISLRQRLIQGPRQVALPLIDLAEQAIRILRGMLYLKGQTLPSAPSGVIAAATHLLAIDLQPVANAMDGRTGMAILTGIHRVLIDLGKRSEHA